MAVKQQIYSIYSRKSATFTRKVIRLPRGSTGQIALVDPVTPSVFLVPRGCAFDKVMSNLEEIKAQGGPVIAIATEGDAEVTARAD